MQFLKSVRGVVLAGAITVALFLGAPILSALGVLPPLTTVDKAPERVAVYYWEAGNNGADDVELELELETEDLEPEPEGDEVEESEASGEGGGLPSDVERTADVDEDAPPEGSAAEGEGDADETTTKTRRRKRRRGKRCEAEPIPEIRKVADDRFRVRRTIIKAYTKDFARLNGLGWSRTHRGDNGKPDGMQVGGIKCNNDLHRAGIRSGDVIHSVNGHKVRNLLQALAVYAKVRKDRVLKVALTRRGKPRTLTYRIAG